jgi:hypothetical protein
VMTKPHVLLLDCELITAENADDYGVFARF